MECKPEGVGGGGGGHEYNNGKNNKNNKKTRDSFLLARIFLIMSSLEQSQVEIKTDSHLSIS